MNFIKESNVFFVNSNTNNKTATASRPSSPMLSSPITNICNASFSCLTNSPFLINRTTKMNQTINKNNDTENFSNITKQTDNGNALVNESSMTSVSGSESTSSLNSNSLVKSIKNMIGLNTNFYKIEPPNSSILNKETTCDSLSSQFIDPFELKKRLFEFSSKVFIILLDCRTYTDFNLKHIKDSVHLNCRDKLTKKRLQTRKLTVKDLISCEEVKSKFDSTGSSDSMKIEGNLPLTATFSTVINNVSDVEDNSETENKPETESKNIIVLYDDMTSDLTDLQSDSNPLKIVQENIKQSGYKKECKILKGGFKKFSEMCPEFCVLKEANQNNQKLRENLPELDIRQSDIENAVMTQILPFLYLGNECDAKNISKLEQNNIYYILNVTKNIPFYDFLSKTGGKKNFIFKRIAVNDNENQNLKEYFEEAINFIDEAKKNSSKVLVHCQAGISRSPTIVIAYLMKNLGFKFNDAYNKVREYRPIIAPNLIFMSQLMDYEAKLLTNNLNEDLNRDNKNFISNSFSPEFSPEDSNSSTSSSGSDSSNSSTTILSDSTDSNNSAGFFSFKSIANDKTKTILVCN